VSEDVKIIAYSRANPYLDGLQEILYRHGDNKSKEMGGKSDTKAEESMPITISVP
jgi:hypothetical protein